MIIVTTKTGKEFKYTGNIIVFQNEYNIVEVTWDETKMNDNIWYIWDCKGTDWFFVEDLISIKGV